jgi:Sec-independent protein translocase protein TatA
MWLIVLIVLLVFGLGGLPQLGYHSYGYGPSGLVLVLVVVLLVFLVWGGRL